MCLPVCVCACVCMRVGLVQAATSANTLWKTNSVGVDGISRQRSSSDLPAVHPPLPPLRVTSTSTFFFPPFSFLARGPYESGRQGHHWQLWAAHRYVPDVAPTAPTLAASVLNPPFIPLLPLKWLTLYSVSPGILTASTLEFLWLCSGLGVVISLMTWQCVDIPSANVWLAVPNAGRKGLSPAAEPNIFTGSVDQPSLLPALSRPKEQGVLHLWVDCFQDTGALPRPWCLWLICRKQL